MCVKTIHYIILIIHNISIVKQKYQLLKTLLEVDVRKNNVY